MVETKDKNATDSRSDGGHLRRAQETYLAEAQRLSHTGSFGWNAKTGDTFWSEETFRIFDYDPALKPSLNLVMRRVHPDDASRVRVVLNLAAKHRRDFNIAHRLLMPDGSVKHVHVVARAIAAESGELNMMGAIMDVTESKRVEEELRRNEQRYRYLFEHAPVALLQIDSRPRMQLLADLRAQGVTEKTLPDYLRERPDILDKFMKSNIIERANQRAIEMFRANGEAELLGPTDRLFRRSPETVIRGVSSRFRRDSTFQEETDVATLDGHVIRALVTVARPGNHELSFISFIDISERVRAQDELRLNEQRYRYLFEYAPVALLQVDSRPRMRLVRELRAQGVTDKSLFTHLREHPDILRQFMESNIIEKANQRAIEMFGAREESELLGSTGWFWQRSPDTLIRGLENRFRGEPVFQEELEVNTLDGRVINTLLTVARPGNHDLTFLSFVDITERVRAIEMLQKLQAEFAHASRVATLGELAASIAHEINQPLAAIMTSADTALRWLSRPEAAVQKAGEAMQRIVDDAGRAADIISRVRAMAAGQTPKYIELSLHEVISEAIAFLGHEIRAKSVEVSLDVPETLPRVSGDRVQLQQVVVNLIINAIQAMHQAQIERAALLIRSSAVDDETMYCTFEDAGRGIAPDHLSHLFDSFFTTKETGMGMGLAVSRSIIEAHGGKLFADNKSALGGARFTVLLPTKREATWR